LIAPNLRGVQILTKSYDSSALLVIKCARQRYADYLRRVWYRRTPTAI